VIGLFRLYGLFNLVFLALLCVHHVWCMPSKMANGLHVTPPTLKKMACFVRSVLPLFFCGCSMIFVPTSVWLLVCAAVMPGPSELTNTSAHACTQARYVFSPIAISILLLVCAVSVSVSRSHAPAGACLLACAVCVVALISLTTPQLMLAHKPASLHQLR
jgi:hypothetical protein